MLLLTNKWYNFVYHFQSHVIKEAIEGYYKSDFFLGGGGRNSKNKNGCVGNVTLQIKI